MGNEQDRDQPKKMLSKHAFKIGISILIQVGDAIQVSNKSIQLTAPQKPCAKLKTNLRKETKELSVKQNF